MKKLFLFAVAAVLMAACSENDVLDKSALQKSEADSGVKFDVYAQRGLTRGAGQYGDLTNSNIGTNGFGVFAYYTASEQYSTSAKPNFMYNQQVTSDGEAWKYEPVKYWPNEYGDAAKSDDIDYVTFFAYAPWTQFEPTTGQLIVPKTMTDKDSIEHYQKYGIVSVNRNQTTGDPVVKYVVDTDPAHSVDLLWGVAAENAADNYTPIDQAGANSGVSVDEGMPFIDLVKPNKPETDKLVFNLRHSLAKVRISVDYVADKNTPAEYGTTAAETEIIDAAKTRIYVRSFAIEGWATQGALNLNNVEKNLPLWKDFDGTKDLAFSKITYFDGLKDGKEGTQSNEQKSETPTGLNPAIIENYCQPDNIMGGPDGQKVIGQTFGKGDADNGIAPKNPGVAAAGDLVKEAAEVAATVQGAEDATGYQGSVLLFGGDPAANEGYFYVIPRAQGEDVNVYISYDVETIDKNLANTLSDGVTKGSTIENNIYKEAIFGEGIDFEPGKQYDIKIHIGMTSVKIDATVSEWIDGTNAAVNLPDNGNGEAGQGGSDQPTVPVATYNVIATDADGTPIAGGPTNLTVTTTGNVTDGYAEVTVSGDASYEGTWYIKVDDLQNGGVVELFSVAPSRMTRGFSGSGKYVKIPATMISGVTVVGNGTVSPDITSMTEGQTVQLTATPSDNNTKFVGWYVEGTETLVSTDNPYTYTISESTKLEARFAAKATYTVTWTAQNQSGELPYRITVPTTNNPQSAQEGTDVTVTLNVSNFEDNYTFDGWYDGKTKITSATSYSSCTITNLDGDKTLIAKFTGKPVTTGVRYRVKINGGDDRRIGNPGFSNVGTSGEDAYYYQFTLTGTTYYIPKSDLKVGDIVYSYTRTNSGTPRNPIYTYTKDENTKITIYRR